MKPKQFCLNQFNDANKWIAVSLCIASFCLLLYELKTVFTSPMALQKLTRSHPRETLPMKISKDSPLFKNTLFGDYIAVLENEAINLPLLDIELVGILYADKGKGSQVIIKIGTEEKIFSADDSIPGGAVIKKIKKNTVEVLYHGVLRQLHLAKPSLIFSEAPTPLI